MKHMERTHKAVGIVLLLVMVFSGLAAEDLLDLYYSIQLEYSNFSFDNALFYVHQIQSSNKLVTVNRDLTEITIELFQRKTIDRGRIKKIRRRLKWLCFTKHFSYLKKGIYVMLRDLDVIDFAIEFYGGGQVTSEVLKKKLHDLYKTEREEDEDLLTFYHYPVYAYLLFQADMTEESVDVLNLIFLDTGLTDHEQQYLFNMNLAMYSYVKGDYPTAYEKIRIVKGKRVVPEFHKYVSAMPYLWESLILYKRNQPAECITAYRTFNRLKMEIDTDRNHIIQSSELLSPMPGVFPPETVYEDLQAVQRLVNDAPLKETESSFRQRE